MTTPRHAETGCRGTVRRPLDALGDPGIELLRRRPCDMKPLKEIGTVVWQRSAPGWFKGHLETSQQCAIVQRRGIATADTGWRRSPQYAKQAPQFAPNIGESMKRDEASRERLVQGLQLPTPS